jgi:hypothetical protein
MADVRVSTGSPELPRDNGQPERGLDDYCQDRVLTEAARELVRKHFLTGMPTPHVRCCSCHFGNVTDFVFAGGRDCCRCDPFDASREDRLEGTALLLQKLHHRAGTVPIYKYTALLSGWEHTFILALMVISPICFCVYAKRHKESFTVWARRHAVNTLCATARAKCEEIADMTFELDVDEYARCLEALHRMDSAGNSGSDMALEAWRDVHCHLLAIKAEAVRKSTLRNCQLSETLPSA